MLTIFTHTVRNKIGLIIVSAILLSLSFHPLGLHFLAWFALVPLLFATQDVKASIAFRRGVIFGFVFSLMSLFWLVFLQIETNIKILMLFGLVLLFLYFGLYYGTSLLIANRIGLWMLPFALSGLEFVRGIGELGFPWLSLGYSQARSPIIIQQASIYGVYGISFWLVLINVLVYQLITLRKAKYLFSCALVIVLPLVYGLFRMKEPIEDLILVGVVQPNIDPNLKFTKAMREQTFSRLIKLSEQLKTSASQNGDSLELIIWPETATPIFITFPGRYQEQVLQLSRRVNTAIFTGTPMYDSEKREMYNGAILIDPRLGITQEYRKIHLVPFSEHIPFEDHIPLFREIDVGGSHFSPGKEYTVFRSKRISFSCLICFESIFPELSRRFVSDGAHLLINITNDGWFGKISGPQQHNDMAILRTVENGVPLARSANTGISMIVDKYGRILKETELFREDIIWNNISVAPIQTVYQMLGDVVPIFSLILITILLFSKIIIQRQR